MPSNEVGVKLLTLFDHGDGKWYHSESLGSKYAFDVILANDNSVSLSSTFGADVSELVQRSASDCIALIARDLALRYAACDEGLNVEVIFVLSIYLVSINDVTTSANTMCASFVMVCCCCK